VRREFLPRDKRAARRNGTSPKTGLESRTQGSPYTSPLPPEQGHPTGLLRWDAGRPQAAFAGLNRSWDTNPYKEENAGSNPASPTYKFRVLQVKHSRGHENPGRHRACVQQQSDNMNKEGLETRGRG